MTITVSHPWTIGQLVGRVKDSNHPDIAALINRAASLSEFIFNIEQEVAAQGGATQRQLARWRMYKAELDKMLNWWGLPANPP